MARKTVGFTELVWICPNCNNKNPGLKKVCGTCGSPQPKEVHFQSSEKQDLIQDQQVIEQVKKGPDIYCPYCGTRNHSGVNSCTQCNGDLKDGVRRNAGQLVGAFKPQQAAQVKCPHCGSHNDETHQFCMKCGGNLTVKPQPVAQSAIPTAKRSFSPLIIIAILGGIALCIILALLVIPGDRSRSALTGTVSSVSWTRSIDIVAITPVTRQDWRELIPTDAQIQYCEERYHHTQDQPDLNSIEVCGTPYVIDTGTGAGEIVQDCVYEVYQDYCEYTAMDWTVVDTLSISGDDNSPYWPEASLSSDQQFGDQKETYQALLDTTEGQKTFTTSDANLFQMLVLGSAWELQTDFFNNIIGLTPVD